MGIAASRDDGGTWKTLGPVGAFNWQVDACPRTVATGSGFIVVWTEATGSETKLRIVLMK